MIISITIGALQKISDESAIFSTNKSEAINVFSTGTVDVVNKLL